jgi:hypothetical protein
MPTLKQAKKVCAQIAEAELALRQNRDWIFDRAWELGKILVELKESIGPGRWQMWLQSNFHEPFRRIAKEKRSEMHPLLQG